MRRVLLALLVAAPAFAQTAPQPQAAPGKAGWAPAGKGCHVWNRSPTIGETAEWNGPCVAGLADGKGVLVWRTGDAEQRYEGTMKAGHLDGQGVYVFSLNQRYEGGFRDDDFEGRGTMIAPGIRYEGDWKGGRKNGRGLLTTLNGDRYDGDFRDDAITGRGVLILSDGRRYEGEFLNGKPNGQGTLSTPDGVASGRWVGGCYSDGQMKVALGTDPASCK